MHFLDFPLYISTLPCSLSSIFVPIADQGAVAVGEVGMGGEVAVGTSSQR